MADVSPAARLTAAAARIREVAEAATPGPWSQVYDERFGWQALVGALASVGLGYWVAGADGATVGFWACCIGIAVSR